MDQPPTIPSDLNATSNGDSPHTNQIPIPVPAPEAASVEDSPADQWQLLPAWFTSRMTDEGAFGLMMSTGMTIGITHIDRIYRGEDGAVWMDVWLQPPGNQFFVNGKSERSFSAPSKHLAASINTNHVMMAFEAA